MIHNFPPDQDLGLLSQNLMTVYPGAPLYFPGVFNRSGSIRKAKNLTSTGGHQIFANDGLCETAKIGLVPEAAQERFWRFSGIGRGVRYDSAEYT